MEQNNNVWKLAICIPFILLLSGCWDRVEIEERGFVIGSAIDFSEDLEGEGALVTLTNQFVIPSVLGTPSDGGGSGEQKAFTNISASGKTVFDINRNMAKMTSRTPFYQHLKVIVLSEELVRKPYLLENMMDFFIREQEMRRGVNVVVAKGEAKKILDVEPMNERYPMMYIESLLQNNNKNAEIIEAIHLDDMHLYLLDKRSYVIPLITTEANNIKYSGAAVIQGAEDRMVGSLFGDELVGLNLIAGKVKEGSIQTKAHGKLMTLEILDTSRKVKVKSKSKQKVVFSVDLKITANVADTFGTDDFTKPENLKTAEKALKEKIVSMTDDAIKVVKDDLKVDAFRLSSELYKNHYKFWQEVEDNWDQGENIFSNSEIHVNVETEVRDAGVSNRTEQRGDK